MKHRTATWTDTRAYRRTKNQMLIEEFIDSGESVWQLEQEYEGEYASNQTMYTTLRSCVKRFGFNVEVAMRNGEVFLIRK